jgi:hypothetical protein
MPTTNVPAEFRPTNLLEVALKQGADDPALRPQFFAELLDSKVLIIPAGSMPRVVNGVTPEDTRIEITRVSVGGRDCVAFFTSEARLPVGAAYLTLSARALFQMTHGAYLVLNPGAAYGKEFFPEEVARLLGGSIFEPTERYVAQKPMKIMIGQPSEYPNELVTALSRLYGHGTEVRRAWVAFYHSPERDREGGLLIGLDVEAEAMNRVAGQTGIVIESVRKTQNYVDLVRYDGFGVSEYFTDQKPFYTRSGIRQFWGKLAH